MATSLNLGSLAERLTVGNILCLIGTTIVLKYREDLLWFFNNLRSPLRLLSGPENDNLILGNLLVFMKALNSNLVEEWVEKYGKTLQFKGFFGAYHLVTLDLRAVNFVMSQPTIFPKSERNRKNLARVLGSGLLSADVDTHKRQRRIMNPSFGQPQIRALVPVFCEKANQLRDIWLDSISNNPEGVTIDVLQGLSRATLDIIGTTDGDEDELAKAFAKIFDSDEELTTFIVAKEITCQALGIPTEGTRRLDANIAVTKRIGAKIVRDKKALLLQEDKDGAGSTERDLLSLLIRSNLAQETNNSQSMSDEEVLAQISTILAAGHETTSTSTTWALYALTLYPTIQNKLRQELLSAGIGEAPSMAEFDKLPYLDNFVREVLRVYPVVPATSRQATQDAIIPVAEGYKDRHGVSRTEIRIQKWDTVIIPILAMNRAKDVWGEDAMDFRPERWDNLPPSVKEMPGVWGHLMTFIHGDQSCIGFRFAVTEMKALIYTLVRSIEFGIDPEIEIEGKTGIVTRPCVKSQPKRGNQMPLICKAVANL